MGRKPKVKLAGASDWVVKILMLHDSIKTAVKMIAAKRGLLHGELLREYIEEGAKRDIKKFKINL